MLVSIYITFSASNNIDTFLQDIIIENLHIEEEVANHSFRSVMSIYGWIQADSMIDNPALVATNEMYFRKFTGWTEAIVLDDKVVVPNNLFNTPSTLQNDTHIYSLKKACYLLFGAETHFVEHSKTG